MARLVHNPLWLPELNLRIMTQIFENAGDYNEITFHDSTHPEIVLAKTFLVKGTASVSSAGVEPVIISANKPWGPMVGREWTQNRDSNVNSMAKFLDEKHHRVEAMEADTQMICVQPYDAYSIVYTSHALSVSETITVDTGYLMFIFGTSYKINDKAIHADFQMFHVKNSSVIVTATEECRVTLIKTVFLE